MRNIFQAAKTVVTMLVLVSGASAQAPAGTDTKAFGLTQKLQERIFDPIEARIKKELFARNV